MRRHRLASRGLRAVAGAAALAAFAPAAAGGQASAGPGRSVRPALDHATVAVRDLKAAGSFFASLGFTIKPGRPHPNSIDNLHIKFADGTELELLTATEPGDALARRYLALIDAGGGGAFVALRHPDVTRLAADLTGSGRPVTRSTSIGLRSLEFADTAALAPIWFLEMPRAIVDRPDIVTHDNGARRLAAVWIAGRAGAALPALARDLGLTVRPVDAPRPGSAAVGLASGELTVVADSEASERGVAGVTIEVDDLAVAARMLARAAVPAARRSDARGRSLLVLPADAFGIWLELLEPEAGVARR